MKRKSLFLFLIFLFPFFRPSSAWAKNLRYPIPELGYCRDQKECFLYCQIPKHTPACWSYQKYFLSPPQKILGESDIAITYPIPELGNCKDAQECFIYCTHPAHQSACTKYGEKMGLIPKEEKDPWQKIASAAKEELGCDSKEACRFFCSQEANFSRCSQFAQKYNLEKKPPSAESLKKIISVEILAKAKEELGCQNEEDCRLFCEKRENLEKCHLFAQKYGLRPPENQKQQEERRKIKEKMILEAKKEFGCASFEECAAFCQKEENREKCFLLSQKFAPSPPATITRLPQEKQNFSSPNFPLQNPPNPPPPQKCQDEKECLDYCQKHPEDCPGFSSPSGSTPSASLPKISPFAAKKEGEFLGPAGCRTEAECRAYCQKHPKECPGFPSPQEKNSAFPLVPTTPFPKTTPPVGVLE